MRLLRVPWTARSDQSILKEISPEYSLEGLILKLKRQYFGHLMWRADSLEKTLMLEKIEGRRRRGRQDEMIEWHHQLNGHEFEQTLGDSEVQGSLACCSPWRYKESDTTERLNNNMTPSKRGEVTPNFSWKYHFLEFNFWVSNTLSFESQVEKGIWSSPRTSHLFPLPSFLPPLPPDIKREND